jgi:hypothetical protein
VRLQFISLGLAGVIQLVIQHLREKLDAGNGKMAAGAGERYLTERAPLGLSQGLPSLSLLCW